MKCSLISYVILLSTITCLVSSQESLRGLWDWVTGIFKKNQNQPNATLFVNFMLSCVPGKVFMYDHNVCFCNVFGTKITCKRKMFSTLVPQLHRNQLQNITVDCSPGKYFKKSCKECVCHSSGKFASCVYEACSKTQKIETRDKCIPGSVFNDRCNGCICGPNGTAACTTLGCGLQEWKDNDSTKCVPGSTLMVGCNDCFCAKDGLKLNCEKMGCEPMSFYHESILNITMKCISNQRFDYNCHQCICDSQGNFAMCSGKPCPHKYNFMGVNDIVEDCNPGMIFANNCNVCICGQDRKGVCTTFSCKTLYGFMYVDDLNFVEPE
ncbi:prolow-density lipoprotein receptor-related protein 1-like isoform X2 [Phymastichus coffea]|uniref:prolow-density lipoprotein receptor-related protein 1-like isoform X2 n=1 Tax=Phymastichus coffea TaxID=108790 RepID=UPI00273C65A8|nr:prolow-density lipoprotein receptor-related protein 1-like isoform X2 [Phymastichus coffea]